MKNNTFFITEEFNHKKILGQIKISDQLSFILENYLKEFLIAKEEGIEYNKRLVIKPSGLKTNNGYDLCDIGLFIE